MNADEKLIEDLYPCRSWCRTVRYHGKHSCDCRFQERARARKLAARIRADAERETERLRKAMSIASASVRSAFRINANPESKPWNRQHLCDFLDGIADTLDAALKGDA